MEWFHQLKIGYDLQKKNFFLFKKKKKNAKYDSIKAQFILYFYKLYIYNNKIKSYIIIINKKK